MAEPRPGLLGSCESVATLGQPIAENCHNPKTRVLGVRLCVTSSLSVATETVGRAEEDVGTMGPLPCRQRGAKSWSVAEQGAGILPEK